MRGVSEKVSTFGAGTTGGDGIGVKGISATAIGVWGQSDGTTTCGVYGIGTGNSWRGIGRSYADTSQSTLGTGIGMQGESADLGVKGISSGSELTGVYSIHTANNGTGVAGRSYADSSQRTLGAGYGVWGDSGSGIGVRGTGKTGVLGLATHAASPVQNPDADVYGSSTNGGSSPPLNKIGVMGESDSNAGVLGLSSLGAGSNGISTNVAGVLGQGTIGVQGSGTTGVQRAGSGVGGRGGIFSGTAAQARLTPSAAAIHPVKGRRGDLFVDKGPALVLQDWQHRSDRCCVEADRLSAVTPRAQKPAR